MAGGTRTVRGGSVARRPRRQLRPPRATDSGAARKRQESGAGSARIAPPSLRLSGAPLSRLGRCQRLPGTSSGSSRALGQLAVPACDKRRGAVGHSLSSAFRQGRAAPGRRRRRSERVRDAFTTTKPRPRLFQRPRQQSGRVPALRISSAPAFLLCGDESGRRSQPGAEHCSRSVRTSGSAAPFEHGRRRSKPRLLHGGHRARDPHATSHEGVRWPAASRTGGTRESTLGGRPCGLSGPSQIASGAAGRAREPRAPSLRSARPQRREPPRPRTTGHRQGSTFTGRARRALSTRRTRTLAIPS